MTILVCNLVQSRAKLQVKCLCVLMLLSFPLTMPEVPGPCRHSITRAHLLTVRRLMDNQLRSGCTITYTFIEQRGLSKCCFVKAALPWILELLTTHFKYSRGSVNDGYVQSLRAFILNIYSQKCVPQINEEVEDKPENFEMVFRGSPSEALQKVSEVLSVYWELITTSNVPINWTCQQEYAEAFGSTVELPTESQTQYITDSYETNSEKEFQRGHIRELYKLGFIIASICGGLLFILMLYCFITRQLLPVARGHHSRSSTDLHWCLASFTLDALPDATSILHGETQTHTAPGLPKWSPSLVLIRTYSASVLRSDRITCTQSRQDSCTNISKSNRQFLMDLGFLRSDKS